MWEHFSYINLVSGKQMKRKENHQPSQSLIRETNFIVFFLSLFDLKGILSTESILEHQNHHCLCAHIMESLSLFHIIYYPLWASQAHNMKIKIIPALPLNFNQAMRIQDILQLEIDILLLRHYSKMDRSSPSLCPVSRSCLMMIDGYFLPSFFPFNLRITGKGFYSSFFLACFPLFPFLLCFLVKVGGSRSCGWISSMLVHQPHNLYRYECIKQVKWSTTNKT